ncbi:uncharacterized protein LOC142985608 isoform X2 [Anticarsia gemmatalis]|uniref:uncharacterized protein LOC142985608 isoform X2 n=1 Tax=Anticarsia gemmatalis TaxID=129554 RepID=UPI003F763908
MTVSLTTVRSRRYDIESEAIRLYGEDIQDVVRRFRKTREYVKILEDKNAKLLLLFDEVVMQALSNVDVELDQRVQQIIGLNKVETTPETSSKKLIKAKAFKSRRFFKNFTITPEQILDNYARFESTAEERNQCINVGYKMAEKMVQLVVQGMGPIPESVTKSLKETSSVTKIVEDLEHFHNYSIEDETRKRTLKVNHIKL